jgi:hypothetical protein
LGTEYCAQHDIIVESRTCPYEASIRATPEYASRVSTLLPLPTFHDDTSLKAMELPQHQHNRFHETVVFISSLVHNLSGTLNKLLAFDKGCSFVVVFGLPGQKHDDDKLRGESRMLLFHSMNFMSHNVTKILQSKSKLRRMF